MVTFHIKDMTCAHCASTIAKAVAAVDTSASVEVDFARKLVRVRGGAPVAEFAEAIQEAGYTPQEVHASLAQTAAPGASGGCGCGCGPKAVPVDIAQSRRSAGGSCCT